MRSLGESRVPPGAENRGDHRGHPPERSQEGWAVALRFMKSVGKPGGAPAPGHERPGSSKIPVPPGRAWRGSRNGPADQAAGQLLDQDGNLYGAV